MRSFVVFLVATLMMPAFGISGDKKYGKPLTVKKPTPIAEILGNPDAFKDQRVLVEAEITDVCQKMGCWIKVKDASSEEEIQVKVEDGVIVFPKDGKGRKVRAEGIVSVTVLSKEERIRKARHEAEEQGKEFDEGSIQGPATVIRIEGEGAVIKE